MHNKERIQLNIRDFTMSHAPNPEDVEHAVFFIRWWQEILSGTIVLLTGMFLRSKGKSIESVIIPISEDEIDHKMKICQQAVLLAIHAELDKRDSKLFRYVEKQDEKMIKHITQIIGK